ncbi:MAG: 30S ribosomal protein S1 [Gammaproteobacteria bacterium]|nr:30S ribosomal protein S1 [Gammaproteobacteria bacterium]HAH67827.1 30S ribosomal protein S1 [Gammaproteobacteria bacterium]
MEQTFEELFESTQYNQNIKRGQIIEANVINITDDHAVLSAGLKSESFVNINQFKNSEGEVEVSIGDKVKVVIEEIEDGEGQTKLSRQKAKNEATWAKLVSASETGEIVTGLIQNRIKGGFMVLIEDVTAFLPGSLVDIRPVRETQYLEGTTSEFKVVKADKTTSNIVVSRKAALLGDSEENRGEMLSKLNEGDVVDGIIKNLTDYGAFIDLGGLDGLLHITDISWKKIKHPSELLNIAEKIQVKIISIDNEKNRVSLGLKQLEDDPWDDLIKNYEIGMKATCKISNITDYGLFMEIDDGIEGLVHVSEIDWTNNNPNPHKIANVGDQVEVMILGIDKEKRRVSLGIKQCHPNPWTDFAEKHSENETIKGKIKSITDFGIFVELDGGIDGLVHISDVSWDNDEDIELSTYKKSDEIETTILAIDSNKQRISLGIKQLDNDPFQEYLAKHPKNSTVSGVISEIDERNALVSLSEKVNGLLNISEVSRDKVDDMRSTFRPNDEIEAKIVGYDKKNRTIKLSIKAKEEIEEKEALESYKKDEKENISKTSLGDLLKSKFVKDKD